LGEVRSGVFAPVGALGTEDVTDTAFTDVRNPVGVDLRGDSFLTVALVQGNGSFVLQKAYNYRVRVYTWCPAAVTLESQKIGVVNPAASGGQAVVVAPLSLFVNGVKLFQQDVAATSV